MKKNKGALTIEASVVLTLFTFFVLFFLGFGRVYRAQSTVSHATLQAADAISTESFLRENLSADDAAKALFVAQHMQGGATVNENLFKSLREISIPNLAKEKFTAAVADSSASANDVLTGLGVKDGLDGVDFSLSRINSATDEVILKATYTVKLQFPFFGINEFEMSKSAKVKNLGKLMYTVTATSADEKMGTASGKVKVKQNGSTVISAYPEYGFKFTSWNDGNTQNPRKIENVSSNLSFIASFQRSSFGVKANITPSGSGTVSGTGSYQLNQVATLRAAPKTGYMFVGWDNDNDGTVDLTGNTQQILVKRDVTVTAKFKLLPRFKIQINYGSQNYYAQGSSYGRYNLNGSPIKEGDKVYRPFNYISEMQLTVDTNIPNANIKWSSSNPSVVSVNSGGYISVNGSAGSLDTAVITATTEFEGATYTSKVNVTVDVLWKLHAYKHSSGTRCFYKEFTDNPRGKGYTNYGIWSHYLLQSANCQDAVCEVPRGTIITNKNKSQYNLHPGSDGIYQTGKNCENFSGYTMWEGTNGAGRHQYGFIYFRDRPVIYIVEIL